MIPRLRVPEKLRSNQSEKNKVIDLSSLDEMERKEKKRISYFNKSLKK